MSASHYGTDGIWDTFAAAVVTVHPPSGGAIVVGEEPLPWPEPTHVVTAWNPGEERPHEQNVRADERLERELDGRGLTHCRAIGSSPDGSWSEEGFAIVGMSRDQALALARAYGQMAIYEVTGTRNVIVACDDGREIPLRPT
jgi:hypothetical protein